MNMNRFLPLLLSSIFFASCGEVYIKGEGNSVTKEISVQDFSSVDISAPVKAEISIQEGAPSVSLSGYENLLKHITVTTKGNELQIEVEDGVSWDADQPVTATITMPKLNSIDLSGAVTADIKGNVNGDKLECDMSGSTRLNILSIQAKTLDVDMSGRGELEVGSGVVETAAYSISGSGKVSSFGLQANDVQIDVSGSGTLQVTALKNMDVSISGAGNVSYKGNPVIKKDISGAGALNAVQ